MSYELIQGDCLDVMRSMPDNSVDSVVTDPPAGINFMNKSWDGNRGGRDQWIAWLTEVLTECNRVMKPGAHALIWAIPRTSHWTGMAIEDAGFDVRDVVTHLFGSGFPKSLAVDKAIDKMAGAEREVVGPNRYNAIRGKTTNGTWKHGEATRFGGSSDITAPATPEAEQWQGWGTALKPAAEFWFLARKPFTGTVAANVLQWGTGAVNVDGCRVGHNEPQGGPSTGLHGKRGGIMGETVSRHRSNTAAATAGRWPANVILDEHAAAELDAQSGVLKSPGSYNYKTPDTRNPRKYGNGKGIPKLTRREGIGDSGGASRFFPVFEPEYDVPFRYQAKASRRERSLGLPEGQTSNHPTVKPIRLMEWLVRLVTPPGGTVLDPFLGSGSTGVAALNEGFSFIGIEREAEYIEIAQRRIEHAATQTRQLEMSADD